MIGMAEYKQVRLNPDVRGLLDDYKMNGESYSIAIGRLFKENEMLMTHLQDLRASHSEYVRLSKMKETSIKIDEDLLSVWEEMMEENPEKSSILNLEYFLRNQMERTLYQNHYIGTGIESREELEEMRKRERTFKIPK